MCPTIVKSDVKVYFRQNAWARKSVLENWVSFSRPCLTDTNLWLKWFLNQRFSVYRIHYIGWSKNWDTWAKHSQILKSTQANLQLKDDLMAKVRQKYFLSTRDFWFVAKRKLSPNIFLADLPTLFLVDQSSEISNKNLKLLIQIFSITFIRLGVIARRKL